MQMCKSSGQQQVTKTMLNTKAEDRRHPVRLDQTQICVRDQRIPSKKPVKSSRKKEIRRVAGQTSVVQRLMLKRREKKIKSRYALPDTK